MVEGSKLREARVVAGLTVQELALAAGVSIKAVEQAEGRGTRLRPSTYRRYRTAAKRLLAARIKALNDLA